MHTVTREIWQKALFKNCDFQDFIRLRPSVKFCLEATLTDTEDGVVVKLRIEDDETKKGPKSVVFEFDTPLPLEHIPEGLIDLRSFLPEFTLSDALKHGLEALITLNSKLAMAILVRETKNQRDEERRVSLELDLYSSVTSEKTPWIGLLWTTFGAIQPFFKIDPEDEDYDN